MSYELKIKAKHLGAEAKIIRFEENKTKQSTKKLKARENTPGVNNLDEIRKWKAAQGFKLQDLQHHRKFVVRPAARRTHLARAYLKGLPYKAVEQRLTSKPAYASKHTYNYISRSVKQIATMVNQYGGQCTPEDIKAWILKE